MLLVGAAGAACVGAALTLRAGRQALAVHAAPATG